MLAGTFSYPGSHSMKKKPDTITATLIIFVITLAVSSFSHITRSSDSYRADHGPAYPDRSELDVQARRN